MTRKMALRIVGTKRWRSRRVRSTPPMPLLGGIDRRPNLWWDTRKYDELGYVREAKRRNDDMASLLERLNNRANDTAPR